MRGSEQKAFFTKCLSKLSILSWRELAVLCVSGIAAGMINGFLGSGGGVVLVLVSSLLFSKNSPESRKSLVPSDPKSCFATAVASILPMSVISVVFYAARGDIDILSYIEFPLCAVLGGVLGAFLTDKTPSSILKTVFAALTVWAGIRML